MGKRASLGRREAETGVGDATIHLGTDQAGQVGDEKTEGIGIGLDRHDDAITKAGI